MTERRRTADALTAAKRQAELATIAKSRFLAAASHDLRQPLQTLALLQGLLAKKVTGDKAQDLVGRIDEALGAMTGMLNTLLDINQIEVGAVKAEIADIPVNELFDRLRDELTYHAQAAGLALRVMPCALIIRSDPRLLEQMIRNLLSNALKYTQRGKVLVGCRRRGEKLRIEIWDTGVGIPDVGVAGDLRRIPSVGQRRPPAQPWPGAGAVHRQEPWRTAWPPRSRVRSLHGKGSVFSIEVPLSPSGAASAPDHRPSEAADAPTQTTPRTGSILIIEDDPEVREHLELFVTRRGL